MSPNVEFHDYSAEVKTTLTEKALIFLDEIGGEIRSLAQRNSRRNTSQTAGSFEYKVDKSNLCVHIGSNHWNAIYEEFGTGEHAINKDGRKGYWVFVDTGEEPKVPTKKGKTYTLQEAKKVMAILRSKGLKAYYTKGKKPNKALLRAFESSKSRIEKTAEHYFGGI